VRVACSFSDSGRSGAGSASDLAVQSGDHRFRQRPRDHARKIVAVCERAARRVQKTDDQLAGVGVDGGGAWLTDEMREIPVNWSSRPPANG